MRFRIGFVKGYTLLKLNEHLVTSGVKRKSGLETSTASVYHPSPMQIPKRARRPLMKIRWNLPSTRITMIQLMHT